MENSVYNDVPLYLSSNESFPPPSLPLQKTKKKTGKIRMLYCTFSIKFNKLL